MSEQEKYHQLYSDLLSEVTKIHQTIQRSIRRGLRALIIVTVLFLTVMFLTKSSKVIFLMLWLATMFAMSTYLIAIEYFNYEMHKRVEKVTQHEHEDLAEVMTPPRLDFRLPERKTERRRVNSSKDTGPCQEASENTNAASEAPPPTAPDVEHCEVEK